MIKLCVEEYISDKRMYEVRDVITRHLKEMFYRIPSIEIFGDSLEFSLYGLDAKSLGLNTLKRWMKELDFSVKCYRTKMGSFNYSKSDGYEYTVVIEK
jgi:hypothetical protein